jgi:hypothetical protein
MMKRWLVLFGLLAISPMLSAENEKITIKSSSAQGKVVLLEADLAGRSVELECDLQQKSCSRLTPGDYSMLRLKNTGVYQDCPNVDIYREGRDPAKDKAVGEYCLLQP